MASIFPLLFLSMLPFLQVSSSSNITLSSSLSTTGPNSSWTSPSGEFAFGFHQVNNTNVLLLAVWYAQIPEKTIVWHAETDGAPVLEGSKVELTANGLTLIDPQGQTMWKVPTDSAPVSHAAMLDTGNFVLSGTNDSVYVWESFGHPTDTLLPSQTLSRGSVLYSRLTQTNYSKGRFQLSFGTNGEVTLNPIAWPSQRPYDPYYRSQTASTNSSESGFQLVFSNSGDFDIVKGNGSRVQLSGLQKIDLQPSQLYRATLDFDGVFRQYTRRRTSDGSGDKSWSVIQYIPDDICKDQISQIGGSGVCGFNSHCITKAGTPTCQCPLGYSRRDPDNEFSGCDPNVPLGCGVDDGSRNPEDVYHLEKVDDWNWPFGDYDSFSPYNQTECEMACLRDCLCAVAIFDGVDTCWMKNLPLLNGRFDGSALALIKVRKPSNSKEGDHHTLLWSLLFGSSGFFNIILLVTISQTVIFARRKKSNKVKQNTNVPETNLRIFTCEELKEATGGFKEELGRGSYGTVFKGVKKFGSENQFVAVKKLENWSEEGKKEFRAEVNVIGKTHHRNLVQLLGYCEEEEEGGGRHRLLLVYEFMSEGNLAHFLFRLPRPDWDLRTRIATGIARGLVYLHEECSSPIIHCDIKPQNILLDESLNARISDFGLAKSLLLNQTRTHTGIRGTRGYVAPEWFKNVAVSVKVDVYSFGVVLLEIISCRRSLEMDFGEELDKAILTDWAYNCYLEGRLDVLVDNDEAAMRDITTLRRWVMTALCCIQNDPSKRPTMKMVLQMLEGFVEVSIPDCTSSNF